MHFEYETEVRLQDTDAAGRMFFARLFDRAHEAYEAMLRRIDSPIEKILSNRAFLLPIIKADAQYREPLMLGQKLKIRVAVLHIGNSSFSLEYDFRTGESTSAARALTVHVCVDGDRGEKKPIPLEFATRLEELRGLAVVE